MKSTAAGKPYLLVHTKRGMRTRQVTQAGWNWVRARYPVSRYLTPDDVPLTYDDYVEMRARGFIGTVEAQQPAAAADRPYMQCSGEELARLFKQHRTDPKVLRELAHELQYRRVPSMRQLRQHVEAALRAHAAAPPQPATRRDDTASVCQYCIAAQRDSARFCPVCGTMRFRSENAPAAGPAKFKAAPAVSPPADESGALVFFGVLRVVVFGGVILLVWKLCSS